MCACILKCIYVKCVGICMLHVVCMVCASIYGISFRIYMHADKKLVFVYAHRYMEVVMYMCVHKRKSFHICVHIYEKHFHICKGYSIYTCRNTEGYWADAQSWTPLKTLQMPHNTGKTWNLLTLGENQGYFPNVFEDEVKRQNIGN